MLVLYGSETDMPHIHTRSTAGKNIDTYDVSKEMLTRFVS